MKVTPPEVGAFEEPSLSGGINSSSVGSSMGLNVNHNDSAHTTIQISSPDPSPVTSSPNHNNNVQGTIV